MNLTRFTRDFALWQEVNKRKNAATFEMLIIIAGDAFAMATILMLIVMRAQWITSDQLEIT